MVKKELAELERRKQNVLRIKEQKAKEFSLFFHAVDQLERSNSSIQAHDDDMDIDTS